MNKQLAQADVGSLTVPGKYRFGPGLYLQVAGPDAKSWFYRYTVRGKERFMGLGSARDVTLAQARKRLDELRITQVSKKIDPLAERKAIAEAERVAKTKAVPFRTRAEQYITAHEGEWRNPKHRAQWRATLQTYAFPAIGHLPASAITASHIVELLRPIWAEKGETARRLRGRIEAVLDYAADPDDASYRNPAALTPQLKKALPKLGKLRRRSRHASLPYDEASAFVTALREQDGIAARALEFLILTAARTNEVIGAHWTEIDNRNAVWTIPAERMKALREHRVPLSSGFACTRRRPRASQRRSSLSWPLRSTAVLCSNDGRAQAHESRRPHRAWIPRDVPDLGRRANHIPAGSSGSGVGASRRRRH